MTSTCETFIFHDICNNSLCGLGISFYPNFWDSILLTFKNCSGHSVSPFACQLPQFTFEMLTSLEFLFWLLLSSLKLYHFRWPINFHDFKYCLHMVVSVGKHHGVFESMCFVIRQTQVLPPWARHLTSSLILSSFSSQASHCGVFSCCRAQPLEHVGFYSCSAQA